MQKPVLNSRMPYMPFNWASHSARVARLTLEERGLFDAVRCELWAVVGCRMPLARLLMLLRIPDGSHEATVLARLVTFGLLREDADGNLFDEVQAHEFGAAVEKGRVNRENGKKGGRPPKRPI